MEGLNRFLGTELPAFEEEFLTALSVPNHGLTRRDTFFYRLLCLIYHRRERTFARPIERELASAPGPLSDFERGRLLGVIESLQKARSISSHMYCMLQSEIQDRKDWSVDKIE